MEEEAEFMEKHNMNDHDLLVRIDERTKSLINTIDGMKGKYTTKEEFRVVRMIVYGMVAMILVAFFGAVIQFFLK